MKKIKLLTPILGLTTLSSMIIPLTSCGNNQNETNRVHINKYDAPKKGEDFSVTFTLDDGYSLDINESYFEFADSNSDVYLDKCLIDSDNKKVTVPGELVTSTSVKVNFKSKKQVIVTDDEKKVAIQRVFEDREDKNMTLSGGGAAQFFDKVGKSEGQQTIYGNYKLVGHNGEIYSESALPSQEVQKTTSYFEKASDNIGWWVITKQSDAYQGAPLTTYPLLWSMNLFGFDLDEFIKDLVYDATLDAYVYELEITSTAEINYLFTFNSDKSLKNIIFDEILVYRSEGNWLHGLLSYSIKDEGKTTISIPEYTKANCVEANQFKLVDTNLETEELGYAPAKITTPVLSSVSGFNLDPKQPTYIDLEGIFNVPEYISASTIMYNGTKQLKEGTDYKLVYGSSSKTYYEIYSNVLDINNDIKCIFNFSAGVACTEGKVVISQTKPA